MQYVDLFMSAYQTGKWSWVPGCSFLWLPTGSLNVSGCAHRQPAHLAYSPSYCSWRLSHPATQGNLGTDQKKITTISLISLPVLILLFKQHAAKDNIITDVKTQSFSKSFLYCKLIVKMQFRDHKTTKQQRELVADPRNDKDSFSVEGNIKTCL